MSESRIDQIRKMLLAEPQDEFLLYALALELEKEGQVPLAIEGIEALLDRNEQYSGAYYKLGELLEKTGQKAKAHEVYLKGLEITRKQNNRKAFGELNEALQNLEDE
jgi:tetratricopeptide (TPR) repeat protein